MFGIIYTLANAAALLVSGTHAAMENADAIKRGKERQAQGKNLQGTYYDRKGAERLLSTGQLAHVWADSFDPCDDKWLWVGAPGVKTRNLSEEKRAMEFQETKSIGKFQGRTVDVYDKRYWSTYAGNRHKVVIQGSYYKDLYTGKMYLCREFKLVYNPNTNRFREDRGAKDGEVRTRLKYYMDVNTAMLVRIADTQSKDYPADLAEKFKTEFNNRQSAGGWYRPDRIISSGPLQEKQDFYCDDFNASDHIYSLCDLRKKQSEESQLVNDRLSKEIPRY